MRDNLAYQENIVEELINGQVVLMSPRPRYNHNRIAFRIAHLFEIYLHGRRCTVIPDGTDLYLDEDNQFVPDVMIVCDRDKVQNDGVHGAPDLVVEVLSPSTARNDRWSKKEVYELHGVREYWLVDPANRTIEQYLLQDGKLELNTIYISYLDWEVAKMTEKERSELVTHFKCSLYDDFELSLDEIFSGLLP